MSRVYLQCIKEIILKNKKITFEWNNCPVIPCKCNVKVRPFESMDVQCPQGNISNNHVGLVASPSTYFRSRLTFFFFFNFISSSLESRENRTYNSQILVTLSPDKVQDILRYCQWRHPSSFGETSHRLKLKRNISICIWLFALLADKQTHFLIMLTTRSPFLKSSKTIFTQQLLETFVIF